MKDIFWKTYSVIYAVTLVALVVGAFVLSIHEGKYIITFVLTLLTPLYVVIIKELIED